MSDEIFHELVDAAEIASGYFRIVPGINKVPIIDWRHWIEEEQEIENFTAFMHSDKGRKANCILALTGIDYIVVDCDSMESFDEIADLLPATPLWTKTGRGMHLWYAVDRTPGAIPIKNSAGKNHVDVRGLGGVVVIPPSPHPSGGHYTWQVFEGGNPVQGALAMMQMPSPDVFHDLPVFTQDHAEIVRQYNGGPADRKITESKKDEFFKQQANKGEDILNVKFEKDLWKSDGQTIVELLDAVVSVGSNNHVAKLVGAMIKAGFGRAAIYARLLEWNMKQDRPWDDSDLMKVFSSIITCELRDNPDSFKDIPIHFDPLDDLRGIDKSKLEEDAQEAVQEAVKSVETDDSTPPFPITRLSELMAREIHSDDFWWDRCLFSGSLMMIAGEPKLGKSFFAMQLMISASIGGVFLSKPFLKPMKCMFVQFELSDYDLKERFKGLISSLSDKDQETAKDNTFIISKVSIDLDDLTSLQKLIATYEAISPDLVVIDPLVNLLNGDENDNRKMAEMMTIVKAINDHTHVSSCIVIHHANKGSRGKDIANPFDLIRGASALRGFYDTGIVLRDSPMGVLVDIEKRSGMKIDPFIITRNKHKGFVISNDVIDREMKVIKENEMSSEDAANHYKGIIRHQVTDLIDDCISGKRGARVSLVIGAVKILGSCRWLELMISLHDLLYDKDEVASERFWNDKAKTARLVSNEGLTEKYTDEEFGRDYIKMK